MLSPIRAGHRDHGDLIGADRLREGAVVFLDLLEDLLVEAHQVHLVDGDDEVLDAEQRADERVPAGLGQDTLARVHQDDREVGGGAAGCHVAGVLFMAGRVGHDELALVGGEGAVGDVDGDALLALGGEAVDEEREVEVAALRAHLLRIGFECRQLVLEQHLGFIEKPSDQGRLAVIDGAAGDEAEKILLLLRVEIGFDVAAGELDETGHQKYPSCFFFSMEAEASLSMTRPCRSEDVATSISSTMSSSVSALESMAPVSG